MKKLTLSFALLSLVACQKAEVPAPKTIQVISTPVVTAKPDTIPDAAAFKLKLVKDEINSDETMFLFNHTASADYLDAEDSPYFMGYGPESLASISSDGRDLVINRLPYKSGMSIALDEGAKESGPFSFQISYINKIPSDIQIWLKDAYLKDSVDVRAGAYSFKVDKSNANSFGSKRFSLVIKNK